MSGTTTIQVLNTKFTADGSQHKRELDKIVNDTKSAYAKIMAYGNAAGNSLKASFQAAARAASSATLNIAAQQTQLNQLTKAASQQAAALNKQTQAQLALNKAIAAQPTPPATPAPGRSLGTGIGRGANVAAPLRAVAGGLKTAGTMATAAITAPVAAIGAASVSQFANFDDSINRAVATAGGASDQLRAKLVDNAKAIGASGIISANDLAKGYLHLVQAGYTLEQSQQALVGVQRFATAGSMDLAKATELLVQSTSALGLRTQDAVKNASNMARVSDTVTKAANISTASIEDFAKSITNKAGAAARILGKDVTELSAVLAAYANTGVKGELAGEKLYMVWRDLQTASLKQSATWQRLGLSVYDTSGKMRNTADIIGSLERLFVGLNDEQKKTALLALGITDRSQAATMQLLGLSGAIRDYQSQLQLANGETERLAKAIEGSFLSQLKTLKNQLQVVGIEIGRVLSPYISTLNSVIAEGVKWWRSLSAPMQETIVIAAGIAAVVGPVVLAFGAIVGAVASAAAGFASLVVLAPEALAVVAGLGVAVTGVAALFAYMAGESTAAWAKVAAPQQYKAVSDTMAKMLHVAQRLFEAFVGWVSTEFPLMLGRALVKAWLGAMQMQAQAIVKLVTMQGQTRERIKRSLDSLAPSTIAAGC